MPKHFYWKSEKTNKGKSDSWMFSVNKVAWEPKIKGLGSLFVFSSELFLMHCCLIFEEMNWFTEKNWESVKTCFKKEMQKKNLSDLELTKDDLTSTHKNTNYKTEYDKLDLIKIKNVFFFERHFK